MKRPHFLTLITLCFPLFFSQTASAQTDAWRQVEIQGLGFVTGLVFHPITGELYNRTDVGGLFRWDGEQDRWISLTDRYARQKSGFPEQVESIALDPQTPWTIYAVMGDNLADHIDDQTAIIKSVDNGETLSLIHI